MKSVNRLLRYSKKKCFIYLLITLYETIEGIQSWTNAPVQQSMLPQNENSQKDNQDVNQLFEEINQELDKLEKYASVKSTQQQMKMHNLAK